GADTGGGGAGAGCAGAGWAAGMARCPTIACFSIAACAPRLGFAGAIAGAWRAPATGAAIPSGNITLEMGCGATSTRPDAGCSFPDRTTICATPAVVAFQVKLTEL